MKFKKFKFKTVKSTNNTAMRIIQNTQCKYGMVISESQIKGKGQYGRKWISYKGNLFVSFFYELNKIKFSISSLTKYNCLLVKKLISKYTHKKIYFKKPNDLLIEKKKICGILQEIIYKSNKKYLITGIGINIIKSPYIKNYPTTNLNEMATKHIKINEVENSLKEIFENNLLKMYSIKGNS
jgi:BirA family biotin operon repressor/biotin-[acetyl-CoA-carboxylase] ligase